MVTVVTCSSWATVTAKANGNTNHMQVGAGLSEEHMKSPKFEHVIVKRGKNAGKEAALTSGNKRMPRDWFFKKYYYSIRRLNLRETEFYGRALWGLMSTFLDDLFSGGIRSNRF